MSGERVLWINGILLPSTNPQELLSYPVNLKKRKKMTFIVEAERSVTVTYNVTGSV